MLPLTWMDGGVESMGLPTAICGFALRPAGLVMRLFVASRLPVGLGNLAALTSSILPFFHTSTTPLDVLQSVDFEYRVVPFSLKTAPVPRFFHPSMEVVVGYT